MKLPLVLLAVASGASPMVSAGDAPVSTVFDLPTVDYNAIADEEPSAAAALLHGLSTLGIVALEGIPGYADSRLIALSSLERDCLAPGAARTFTATMLGDGTTRRTAGATTKPGKNGRRGVQK